MLFFNLPFSTLVLSQMPISCLMSFLHKTDFPFLYSVLTLVRLSLKSNLFLKSSSGGIGIVEFGCWAGFGLILIAKVARTSSLPILTKSRFMFSEKKSVKQILPTGPFRAADRVVGRDFCLGKGEGLGWVDGWVKGFFEGFRARLFCRRKTGLEPEDFEVKGVQGLLVVLRLVEGSIEVLTRSLFKEKIGFRCIVVIRIIGDLG